MRLALALLLAGCASAPPSCPKPVVVGTQTKPDACPGPPRPDECVAAWYARADTPRCVDDWIDRLAEHRNTKRKKK